MESESVEPGRLLQGVIEASDPCGGGGGGGKEEEEVVVVVEKKRREICWDGCGRPSSVCLCAYLPPSPIPTSTRVLILHHPHELRSNKLATLPILTRCLRDLLALPGRRLRLGSSPLLDSLHRHRSATAIFLFPGAGAADLARWAADTPPAARSNPVLIVFDGTWTHAREMAVASLPFLSGFARRVSLGEYDEGKEGDSTFESELVLRKEPYRGCVSTMEAVARALRLLEPDGAGKEVEERLLSVLRAMVGFQARHLKTMKSRPRLRKKKEIKKDEDQEVADNLLDEITGTPPA